MSVSRSHENPEENFISPPASQWKKPRQQGKRCAVRRCHRTLSAGAISSLGLLGFCDKDRGERKERGGGASHRDQFLVPRYHKFISLRQQCKQDVGFL